MFKITPNPLFTHVCLMTDGLVICQMSPDVARDFAKGLVRLADALESDQGRKIASLVEDFRGAVESEEPLVDALG